MSDYTPHDRLTDPVVVAAAKALHAAHEARVRALHAAHEARFSARYPYGLDGNGSPVAPAFESLAPGYADGYLYRGRDVVRSLQLADGDADEAVKFIIPRFFGHATATNATRRNYARQAAVDVLYALKAAGLSL